MIKEAIYTLLGSKNWAGNRGIHMAELTLPLVPSGQDSNIMPRRGEACLDKIKQIFNILFLLFGARPCGIACRTEDQLE